MASTNRLLYLSITIAFISYLYTVYTRHKTQSVEQAILDAWKRIIQEPWAKFERILVGINCNVDLIVSGSKLVSRMRIRPANPTDHEDIKSMDHFRETFTLFFSRGAPGERYMSNEQLFSSLASVAEQEIKPSEFAIGGNAALIANKIASKHPQTKVLLVGPIGPRLKALLHPGVLTQNSTQMSKDEIHLILEFKQGDKWGDHVAQSSSRFITSHDTFSSSSDVIKMFFDSVRSYKPDLIVLSGLHLIEFQSAAIREEKLKVIHGGLRELGSDVPIHLELGSMADIEFGKHVLDQIVPYVSSLGLNEQEMWYVSRVGAGPFAHDFPIRATSIHAHMATEIVSWILTAFGMDNGKDYRLQRVHFHCLTYHMSATLGNNWSNGAAALTAGARLAGKQACDGKGAEVETLDPKTVELRVSSGVILDQRDHNLRFDPQQGVASWKRDNLIFMYTPVLVCKNPTKTVGLGDAISATGLIYSQFDRNGQ